MLFSLLFDSQPFSYGLVDLRDCGWLVGITKSNTNTSTMLYYAVLLNYLAQTTTTTTLHPPSFKPQSNPPQSS